MTTSGVLFGNSNTMLLDKKIPIGYVLNKVKYELVYVLIITSIIHYFTTRYHYLLPEMPLTIPAFLGTAISILLSFKLSQSYDRWWEARKIWGAIVNDSRTFIIQLQTLVKNTPNGAIKTFAYRQIAWCYALGQSFRDKEPTDGLENYISVDEILSILKHNNKPLALLQQHGKDVAALYNAGCLDSITCVQLNNTLVRFSDSMGMAERIKNTVFPATYRRFLHFAIYLFIITLSIALRDTPSYFEIPLLLVISAVFFLLERSASQMQDPFDNKPTDTPVTSIARTIEINIKQLLGETDIPDPLKSSGYYIN